MNFDSFTSFLINLKFFFLLFTFAWVVEQVDKFFIIEFEKADPDQILFGVSCPLDSIEYILDGSRDNTFILFGEFVAFHRMGFSCPSLPIGKDSPVVAFQNAFDDWESCLLEDLLLPTSGPEGGIEGEILAGTCMVLLGGRIIHTDSPGLFVDLHHQPHVLLFCIGRPATNHHLHRLCFPCDFGHGFKLLKIILT